MLKWTPGPRCGSKHSEGGTIIHKLLMGVNECVSLKCDGSEISSAQESSR